jgi:glycosyltransferase involved in cell wall biosynthesis
VPSNEDLRRALDEQSEALERQQAEIDALRESVRTLSNFAGMINAERDRSLTLSRPALGINPQYASRPLRVPRSYLNALPPDPVPRISIVTPSFNQGAYIERTVVSVLSQGYANLEYVVQDGGSNDCTQEVLARYRNQLARVVSGPDGGQADAINRGLHGSTGEVMAYLNSDDMLLPGSLAYVARFFAQNPEVDVVYGNRIVIDAADRDIGMWVLPRHRDWVVTIQDFVPQETLWWRRRAWERVGARFDTELYYAMDWDLLLRFVAGKVRLAHVPRFLGAFRTHPASKTIAALQIALKEVAMLRERWHGSVLSTDEIEQRLKPFFRRQKALHLCQLAYDRVPTPRVNVVGGSAASVVITAAADPPD